MSWLVVAVSVPEVGLGGHLVCVQHVHAWQARQWLEADARDDRGGHAAWVCVVVVVVPASCPAAASVAETPLVRVEGCDAVEALVLHGAIGEAGAAF